ncbi:MAG: hypothetical protein K9M19_06185 [Candidatus Marinimicrobia bacterium]|nr:hypothetical protein [Candidatus Neomarinimicrobiota bacterium]
MKMDSQTFQLTDSGNLGRNLLMLGGLGLVLTLVGYFVDHEQFFFSYLTAFAYWTTLGLGALFFTMLHHLTGAVWSVVLRRMMETVAAVLPVMLIFFLPIIFGMHSLYHWSHADVVAHDPILAQKAGYLNPTFFIIRAVVFFGIWFLVARGLYRTSLAQDSGHTDSMQAKLRKLSAGGMVLYAFTVSFAAFDWLMSLDPHWYSTIFGVYIFSGGFLAILAFLVIFTNWLLRRDVLSGIVTIEHHHDLGRLLFAFTVWWAYIAASQYFLIWYGNLPEETHWFLDRWVESWRPWSLFIIAFHFAIPFFVLVFRANKRSRPVLVSMAILFLIMHWADLYWVIMPTLHKTGVQLSWMDFTAWIGMGGIYLGLFWKRFTAHPMVPAGDPNLKKSMEVVH